MEKDFDISIVISSYNRENKVRQTIDSILANDLSPFHKVEVIVIDDGSPEPVEKLMPPSTLIPEKVSMRLITQKNAGIGATRNRGFREAQSELVFFLDDDIILQPDTIRKMYEAELEHPGAVIYGNYPFITHNSEALRKFAVQLYNYDKISTEKVFDRVDAITSGLLLVNKNRLGYPEKFYRDDMTIPAAEEHEIIARFNKMGIPIYHAQHIITTHNHHLELDWLASQQFKYGLATAEAFTKCPDILEMEKFAAMRKSLESKGWTGWVKSLLTTGPGRKILFGYAKFLEKYFPNSRHNKVFGWLTTVSFYAGYKQGLKRFAS